MHDPTMMPRRNPPSHRSGRCASGCPRLSYLCAISSSFMLTRMRTLCLAPHCSVRHPAERDVLHCCPPLSRTRAKIFEVRLQERAGFSASGSGQSLFG